MSYESTGRTESAPEFWHESKEHSRKIAQAVNGILNGQTNNAFVVTLESGGTSTTVPFAPSRSGGSVLLFPQNDAAATLSRTQNVYAETRAGEVLVTHGPAVGGEVFSLVVVG